MIFIAWLPGAADPIAVPRPRKCPRPHRCATSDEGTHIVRATRGSSSSAPWHSGVFWVAPPRAVVALWEAERRCLGVAISGGRDWTQKDTAGRCSPVFFYLLHGRWRCDVLGRPCSAMLCFAFAGHAEACSLSTGCTVPTEVPVQHEREASNLRYWAIPSTVPRYSLYVRHSVAVCAVRSGTTALYGGRI